MNKYVSLSAADARNIMRDPMLVMALAGPLILAVAVRHSLRFLTEWLGHAGVMDLTVYYDLILIETLLLLPLMLGMIAGFLMLDERDEQLISYFAVTPLTKSGYLIYRLSSPVLLSAAYTVFFVYFIDLVRISPVQLVLLTLLLSLQAPAVSLLLLAFAANKVEGLALSKGIGITMAAPIAIYFAPEPWSWLTSMLPSFWIAKAYWAGQQASPYTVWFYSAAFAIHLLLIGWFYRRYARRND
ncbi:hypothetical protein [Paenibacillus sp. J2TS4]|uniref:hypothetical protein n=1 Tax=Paenibacillus sp. J2TS4 TaxID=2807194 RepID=UPI001B0700FD|nr:hypothetical protein [Paenibacillus sp. J2TS4]GIP34692.1 hypothetical protein J2TS4_39020 [Paenibacillus sp. J2TS4]